MKKIAKVLLSRIVIVGVLICLLYTSLLGSPTINRNAVPPIWNLLAHIDAIGNQKKPVAVFGSFGWSGEAVPLLNGYLSNLKFNVAMDGLKVTFVPSEEDLKKAFAYGKEFAEKL